jgi:hypothetical protein
MVICGKGIKGRVYKSSMRARNKVFGVGGIFLSASGHYNGQGPFPLPDINMCCYRLDNLSVQTIDGIGAVSFCYKQLEIKLSSLIQKVDCTGWKLIIRTALNFMPRFPD